MLKESIRIVVCGDESVGKTSLINSLVKDNFTNKSDSQIITIKREDYENDDTKDSINTLNDSIDHFIPNITYLVDASSSNLIKEVRQADVIALIYSDHYTYERISLHYIPLFRSLGVNLPIVICANKSDLLPSNSFKKINSDEFLPLINEFKEIESCIRCSAKSKQNLVNILYLCQRLVTHPISPIFDSKEGNLKPLAISALKRIFFLVDKDLDGLLNFQEFNDLHLKCFNKSPSLDEFEEIVQTINKIILTNSTGISEDGFILLNKIYAESGRHETIWGILRAFKYTNSLSLQDDYLYPEININPLSSVELSPLGYKFLVDLFLKFDKDNDGGLSQLELNELFKPTPGIPQLWIDCQFPSSIVVNDEGYVTLQGWLAQWNLTTFLNYRVALEYFSYLGFDEGLSTKAIKVTKPRKKRKRQGKIYRQTINDRNVFNCFLIGAPKSGKTSVLESFLRNSYSETYSPTIKPKICIKDIELRGGKQCYLILQEFGELEPAILENQLRLDQCDVICYCYDSSDSESFQYLVDLREKYESNLNEIPSIFVALKADLDKQQQRSDLQPENYTKKLYLNSPLHVSSSWTTSLHELLLQLVDVAKLPSTATPGFEQEPEAADLENLKHIFMAGGAMTVLTIVSIWIWKSSLQSRQ